MPGLDATETGNELSHPKFELTGLAMFGRFGVAQDAIAIWGHTYMTSTLGGGGGFLKSRQTR